MDGEKESWRGGLTSKFSVFPSICWSLTMIQTLYLNSLLILSVNLWLSSIKDEKPRSAETKWLASGQWRIWVIMFTWRTMGKCHFCVTTQCPPFLILPGTSFTIQNYSVQNKELGFSHTAQAKRAVNCAYSGLKNAFSPQPQGNASVCIS